MHACGFTIHTCPLPRPHMQIMCLYLTKYASLVGVVICVREERYDYHLSRSPQYISDPQNGGQHTEVYKRDVTVQRKHPISLLRLILITSR